MGGGGGGEWEGRNEHAGYETEHLQLLTTSNLPKALLFQIEKSGKRDSYSGKSSGTHFVQVEK